MPREYAQKTSSRLLLIKFNIVSDYSDGKKRYFAEYFRRRRVTERWPGTAGYPVDSRGQNLKRHFFSSPKEVFLEAEAHCALYLSQRTPYQQSENSASIKRAEANVKMQAEKTKAQLEQLSNEAKEVISKASLNTVEALKANASVSGSRSIRRMAQVDRRRKRCRIDGTFCTGQPQRAAKKGFGTALCS
jgi:hypothetical protein